MKQEIKNVDLFPYFLILPVSLCLLTVFFYPLIKNIVMSFYSVEFVKEGPFCGLENYKRMLSDRLFWHAVKITLIYVVTYTVSVFALGFFTALLVNCSFKGRKFARMMITSPFAIPDVVAVLVWMWMYDYSFGVLNFLLMKIGLIGEPIMWLQNASTALYSVLLVTIWRLFPAHSLLLLAALQSIPKELYEAAMIDGANSIHKFFYITIPGIMPVVNVLLVLTIMWSFKRFTILWVLTRGGPIHASETLVVQLYRKAFMYSEMGEAAALGTFGILGLMFIITMFTVVRQKEEEKLYI